MKKEIDMTSMIDFESEKRWKDVRMGDQAVGAVMMALQKSLMEQSDIVPVLKGFKFVRDIETNELIVTNPPTFKLDNDEEGSE
tara:strand:+ start:862 stop:1110 length:249 start_codon:yes stop_codon:yes gene_type:complete